MFFLFLLYSCTYLGLFVTRLMAHYAPMTAMSLFVNILIHPFGSSARSDMETLSSAAGITRSIPTAALSVREMEHVEDIGEFMMELSRLGSCAIWKAKKEGKSCGT